MRINITPVDVLFFRDSKPFGRSMEHFAKSIFPPSSQTLYGALRTKVLEDLGCNYMEYRNGRLVLANEDSLEKVKKAEGEIGFPDRVGSFSLKGPLLLKDNNTIYLKVPADVKEIDGGYKVLEPFDWTNSNVETDLETIGNYPHIKTDSGVKDAKGYISLQTFNDYALGAEIKEVVSCEEVFSHEIRTVIGTEAERNTSKEGQLYTVGFVRMQKDWSFYAEIDSLSFLPEAGLIKFGGANRVCEYETMDDCPLKHYKMNEIKDSIKESKKFKIVFLTHAEFNNGWISNSFSRDLELQLEGSLKIRLISACLCRPDVILGWDLAKKKAKPLRRLVPAGSVYYFELLEGGVDELFKKLNLVNFSDNNQNMGFGLTLIGGW